MEDHETEKELQNANISVVFAGLSCVGWLIPIVGIPISIAGIVFAVKSIMRDRAVVAMIICILTLAVGAFNAYRGAIIGQKAGEQIQQQYYSQ